MKSAPGGYTLALHVGCVLLSAANVDVLRCYHTHFNGWGGLPRCDADGTGMASPCASWDRQAHADHTTVVDCMFGQFATENPPPGGGLYTHCVETLVYDPLVTRNDTDSRGQTRIYACAKASQAPACNNSNAVSESAAESGWSFQSVAATNSSNSSLWNITQWCCDDANECNVPWTVREAREAAWQAKLIAAPTMGFTYSQYGPYMGLENRPESWDPTDKCKALNVGPPHAPISQFSASVAEVGTCKSIRRTSQFDTRVLPRYVEQSDLAQTADRWVSSCIECDTLPGDGRVGIGRNSYIPGTARHYFYSADTCQPLSLVAERALKLVPCAARSNDPLPSTSTDGMTSYSAKCGVPAGDQSVAGVISVRSCPRPGRAFRLLEYGTDSRCTGSAQTLRLALGDGTVGSCVNNLDASRADLDFLNRSGDVGSMQVCCEGAQVTISLFKGRSCASTAYTGLRTIILDASGTCGWSDQLGDLDSHTNAPRGAFFKAVDVSTDTLAAACSTRTIQPCAKLNVLRSLGLYFVMYPAELPSLATASTTRAKFLQEFRAQVSAAAGLSDPNRVSFDRVERGIVSRLYFHFRDPTLGEPSTTEALKTLRKSLVDCQLRLGNVLLSSSSLHPLPSAAEGGADCVDLSTAASMETGAVAAADKEQGSLLAVVVIAAVAVICAFIGTVLLMRRSHKCQKLMHGDKIYTSQEEAEDVARTAAGQLSGKPSERNRIFDSYSSKRLPGLSHESTSGISVETSQPPVQQLEIDDVHSSSESELGLSPQSDLSSMSDRRTKPGSLKSPSRRQHLKSSSSFHGDSPGSNLTSTSRKGSRPGSKTKVASSGSGGIRSSSSKRHGSKRHRSSRRHHSSRSSSGEGDATGSSGSSLDSASLRRNGVSFKLRDVKALAQLQYDEGSGGQG